MDLLNSKESYYKAISISALHISEKTISGREFEKCTFERCVFINCMFEKCVFSDCLFRDCVLSAVKLTNSTFTDAKFERCKTIGIDWTLARTVRFLRFFECELDYSNFSFMKLPELKITDSQAKEVRFIETDLTGGEFERTDFEGTKFHNCNLTKANFKYATNYLIDVTANKVKKARFSLPEAVSLLRGLEVVIEN